MMAGGEELDKLEVELKEMNRVFLSNANRYRFRATK